MYSCLQWSTRLDSTRRYSTVCLAWKCKTESLPPFKTIRQKDHGQARKSGASKADMDIFT